MWVKARSKSEALGGEPAAGWPWLEQASTAKKKFSGWEGVHQGTRSLTFQMYFIYKALNPFKTIYVPHRFDIALLLN